MNFTPNNMEVRTLFRTIPQFNIPVFQRDYSWDKQYYSKFIEDIIGALSVDNGVLKDNPYFIGTMVFTNTNDEKIKDVVDGQQRLTVITILFSVIADKFSLIDENDLADATFKYIKEKNDNAEFVTHLKSDTSYPYLDSFIQSRKKENASPAQSDEEKNLKDTYDFFSKELSEENLRKLETFKEVKEYKKILISIRDQILSSVLISISTSDRDSAYRIFEILNAKGKNLASIDLIKNIVFEEFYGDANGLEGEAEKSWENVKSNLRTRNQNIGLATFYRQFWISKYKKVTNAKLYDSFKKYITDQKKEEKKIKYFNFIKDMEKESETYIKIIQPVLSEDFDNRQEYDWLVQSLKTLNDTFGLVQTRVLLLALFDIKNRNLISTPKFKEVILYIENFVFIYTGIAKKPANMYEARFSNLAIKLRKSKSKSDTNEILKDLLYTKFNEKDIPYSEFESGFIEQTFRKGRYNSNILTKYIIKKISCYFEANELFSNGTIEHILNENSKEEETINIGNLIFLEDKYNQEAGDLSYVEKREIYGKSKNNQVKKFLEEYPEFDNKNVENRAKNLAELYYTKILGKKIE